MLDRPAPKSNLTEQQEQWLSDMRAEFQVRFAAVADFATQLCAQARQENWAEKLRRRHTEQQMKYQTATGNERLNMEAQRDFDEEEDGSYR